MGVYTVAAEISAVAHMTHMDLGIYILYDTVFGLVQHPERLKTCVYIYTYTATTGNDSSHVYNPKSGEGSSNHGFGSSRQHRDS